MSTLYEITGQYLELLDMLQNSDDIEGEILKDTLEGIEGELEVKAENYAKIIKELTLDAKKFEESRICGRGCRKHPVTSSSGG